jgi:voltage-gated potassium channel Kch
MAAEGPISLNRAVYFSFVTIATLGYGDIVPASDVAGGIAVVEAVIGQFYLVVLVARLVSLYARQSDT